MSTPTVPTFDTTNLIAQIQAIAADHEANAADAAKWRELLAHCEERGFGPNLTPSQIAGFVPYADRIAEVVAASAARKSRKGVPLGPRGSRPASGHDVAGPGEGEAGDDD